ncbi:ROK family protein [Micromonospora sp. ATA51]|uniref:ROK family protein n=1 Tax=Micromonospora sp. ATA51 TaxID=2806098 RepID=UPI001A4FEB21|nr:ROK family protein [Micromonospora sp. ATA51]MBM0228915.1 ROK family protein [Micromonospora sp. ATA51]
MTASAPLIGLDIGGTKTAAALIGPDGDVLERRQVPTPARSGPEAVLDAAAVLAADLLDAAGSGPVGVGTAGTVDPATGTIRYATDSLPGWTGTPVAHALAERLARPVLVTNDVNAAALGECWSGAGRARTHLLLVSIGTGLGAAIIRNGRIEAGARGGAGGVGHLPVPSAERLRCGCGRYGHLEAIASGSGLSAAYAVETGARVTGQAVAQRAAAGDAVAQQVLDRAGTVLGAALAGLVALLDPQAVLVAGGAAGALLPAASAAYSAELPAGWADVPLLPAALGADAVMVGAVRLVMTHSEQ